jgi:hypothetical protein
MDRAAAVEAAAKTQRGGTMKVVSLVIFTTAAALREARESPAPA